MKSDDKLISNKVQQELNAPNSDRGVAVLGGCIVEAALQELLSHILIKTSETSKFIERSNASTLRMLAYSTGVIPKELHDEIFQLARIRNSMAHNFKNESFDSPELAKLIDNLVAPSRFGKLIGTPFNIEGGKIAQTIKDLPRRMQFIASVAAVTTTLEHLKSEHRSFQESKRFFIDPIASK